MDQTEERFINIEIKLAEQEDLVDTLNKTVYEQARRIDQLEEIIAKLADHVRTASQNGPGVLPHERPPHY